MGDSKDNLTAPANKPTHTPGPWRYRPHKYDDWGWIRAANDELVARVGIASDNEEELNEHRRKRTDPFWADAQLVTAAPELLAALKDALGTITHHPNLQGNEQALWPVAQTIQQATAAIAKAEGR